MQFTRKTSYSKSIIGLLIKLILIAIIFIGITFLLNKLDFPEAIMPSNTRFFFEFISFFIEKTQICLNLKLINDICNLKEKQALDEITH